MLETNQSNNWNLLCLDLISIEENVLKISTANENVWNMESWKKYEKLIAHFNTTTTSNKIGNKKRTCNNIFSHFTYIVANVMNFM